MVLDTITKECIHPGSSVASRKMIMNTISPVSVIEPELDSSFPFDVSPDEFELVREADGSNLAIFCRTPEGSKHRSPYREFENKYRPSPRRASLGTATTNNGGLYSARRRQTWTSRTNDDVDATSMDGAITSKTRFPRLRSDSFVDVAGNDQGGNIPMTSTTNRARDKLGATVNRLSIKLSKRSSSYISDSSRSGASSSLSPSSSTISSNEGLEENCTISAPSRTNKLRDHNDGVGDIFYSDSHLKHDSTASRVPIAESLSNDVWWSGDPTQSNNNHRELKKTESVLRRGSNAATRCRLQSVDVHPCGAFRSVKFVEPLVTEVRHRPTILPQEKDQLFYSPYEIRMFKIDFRYRMENGYGAEEFDEFFEDFEANICGQCLC